MAVGLATRAHAVWTHKRTLPYRYRSRISHNLWPIHPAPTVRQARATEDGHPAPAIRGADERSPVPGSSNDDITGAGGNDEEEDDEDEDEMPLTRAQIQARSAASVVHAMSGNGRAPFQLP